MGFNRMASTGRRVVYGFITKLFSNHLIIIRCYFPLILVGKLLRKELHFGHPFLEFLCCTVGMIGTLHLRSMRRRLLKDFGTCMANRTQNPTLPLPQHSELPYCRHHRRRLLSATTAMSCSLPLLLRGKGWG